MSSVTNAALFETWTPPESCWSPWAKPVLFAHATSVNTLNALPASDDGAWKDLPSADGHTALIVELPGVAAVKAGVELAALGYQPVPLFNTTPGPKAALDAGAIIAALIVGAERLAQMPLPADAPPAFLLDSHRLTHARPAPGGYDNRWVVFPQDFPSAELLRARGVEDVVVIQISNRAPQDDLRDVLVRYQRGGLHLRMMRRDVPTPPVEIDLPRFRPWRWLRALAILGLGLRRNSAGGFGSVVPMPSSGG